MLLDVDALAKAESENWVFKGAACAPGETRCLITAVARRRRCRGDARIRPQDHEADGRWLSRCRKPRSNSIILIENTVLFGTAKDGETNSGYARTVKVWKRGTPIASAPLLYEGKKEDVLVAPMVAHTKAGDFAFVVRAVSFFESEYFAVENGKTRKLDMPLSADVQRHDRRRR